MKAQGKSTWLVGATVGVLLLSAAESMAVDVTWSVPGPAPWNVDENWSDPNGLMVVPEVDFEDTAVINNGGTAEVAEAVPDVFGLTLSRGLVDIQQGGSLAVVEEGGSGGNTSIGSGGTLRLSGNGQFETGSLSGDGLIDLRDKDVSFSVNNDYSASTLKLAVSGDGNPVVEVGGTARLRGAVVADFADEVELSFGSAWQFLTANNVVSQNAEVVLPEGTVLDRGLQVQITASDNNASITVGSLPILTLDRATGHAEIQNVVGEPLDITGYSIASDLGLLNPEGWTSLTDQQVEGWTEANPRPQRISELNPLSQSTFEVGQALDLGNAYNGGATNPRDEDVTFEVSTPDGSVLQGLVEYTGPPNDLVLRVDPESGEATVRNLSAFVDPFDVTGYSIVSRSGALSVDEWNSFAESGAAGDGWLEAAPTASAISEINPTGSSVFDTGTQIALGPIFSVGGTQDLVLEFTTVEGDDVFVGTVEYGELGGVVLPGDCNGDGVVDAGDLQCVGSIGERDTVLGAIPTLAGDLDGDGAVAFPDFLVLSANFNVNVDNYTQGDIDLNGIVAFPDFLILSANFGKVPEAAGAAAAVPEPTGLAIMSLGALFMLARCRNRSA